MACQHQCEIRISAAGSIWVKPMPVAPPRLADPEQAAATSTERVRRHRARKLLETCQSAGHHTLPAGQEIPQQGARQQNPKAPATAETARNVSRVSAPSLPPSPPSPTPPSSTPTHTPGPAPARTRGSLRTLRQKHTETSLQMADQEPIPKALQTPAFLTAWAEWHQHRSTLARMNPGKQWSAMAARHTLADCARHGAERAVEAIQSAIAGGWQSLIWERLTLPTKDNPNPQGSQVRLQPLYVRNKNRAYTVESATYGLTGEEIGMFCPDQK